ncbi:Lsr2 family protein [Arthrobacter sp. UYCu712]|uniref:histone-like nucleoid-structuring protein Lsr2 n=1 Tax=Arthrobacter sp. UYCu712 TaxID=3156340 RepID=UPI003396071B
MARKIHVQLIDDLSGEDAEETVRFSVDGADYEIDLTADHAEELRAALAEYISNGRRLRGPSASRAGTSAPMSRDETRRIRDWANSNGYTPSSRGRIRQDIQQAYAAAHA